MEGKFIVLYGANNIGKSTQATETVTSILRLGLSPRAVHIKYPIYDLEPTGPIINTQLRKERTMNDWELQRMFVQNRRDFEPVLVQLLEEGVWVVAEDYVGTGKAWGVTQGVPLSEMEKMNEGLLPEDLAILLNGERFVNSGAVEKGHRYEDGPNWERSRKVHLELAERYGWEIVNANQSVDKVNSDIVKILKNKLVAA